MHHPSEVVARRPEIRLQHHQHVLVWQAETTHASLEKRTSRLWDGPFGMALFNGASIAQMGAGLDHEIRLDLEIGPITIYILSWNMKP